MLNTTNGTSAAEEEYFDHSYFGMAIVSCLTIMSAIGTVLNYSAMSYMRRYFNLNVSIFCLVFIDTASCFVGCATFLVVNVMMLLNINMPLMCSFIFVAVYPPQTVGRITTAQVSIIRYKAIRLSQKNEKLDDKLALRASLAIVGLVIALTFIYIIYHISNDLPYSTGNEICLRGEKAARPGPLAILPILINFIGDCVSITYDILIIRETKKVEDAYIEMRSMGSQLRQRRAIKKLFNSVPVRATVFSTVTSMPLILIMIVLTASGVDKIITSMVILFGALLLLATRTPVATKTIFANKRKEDLRTREERQKKENEYAAQERVKREMRKLAREYKPPTEYTMHI